MDATVEITKSFAADARTKKRRITADQGIKLFFGSNAVVAIIVLALITIFLFREGFGFFGQNLTNVRLYRQSGQEYVDLIRKHADQHSALSRALSLIRLRQFRVAQRAKVPLEEINASLAPFDEFATAFSDAAEPLNGIVSDAGELATELKARLAVQAGAIDQETDLEESGATDEAPQVNVTPVAVEAMLTSLRESTPAFEAAAGTIRTQVEALLAAVPQLPD
ncbi:MAG TPA: phosphate ABC transporter permease subunit PstC, partial [Chthoniobacterales bacterium]|nr:phosphate ABC transporter permease subunit PstC [Chthoniobacterales bacterium]